MHMVRVIGSSALDTLVKVERLPRRGEGVNGYLIQRNPGGNAANTAAQCAALGVDVEFISALGADPAGAAIREACAKFPSLTTHFTSISNTREATIMVEDDGERTIISCVPPEGSDPEPLPLSTTPRVAWIDVRKDAWRATFHALNESTMKGLPISRLADEATSGRSWEFVVGSLEDRPLPEEDVLKAAGLRFCVMTEGGAGGQTWTASGGWQSWDSLPVEEVVDSCGAGDAFLAGVLSALDAGEDVSGAVEAGAACGARAVGQRGSWPS